MKKTVNSSRNKALDKLLAENEQLVHTAGVKVVSHTQREIGEWVQHTVMVDGYDVPFKFKRTKKYKSLQDQLVNLTYYPETETVAGFEMEIMKVVRVKRY